MKFNRDKIILILIIGLLVLLLVGGGVFYFITKNNQINLVINTQKQNQVQENQQGLSKDKKTLTQEERNNLTGKKMTDDQARVFFDTTEIISNNLPESIEFWTEAYCPGNGDVYNYNFDNLKYNNTDYYFLDSCDQGDIGSHGGCQTCAMSKIKLIPIGCETDEQKYYETINGKIFLVTTCPQGSECQIKIFKNNTSQIIKLEYRVPLYISFDDDYNFDDYSDLKISYGEIGAGSGKLNEQNDIFLFDKDKNIFIHNDDISGSRINIDKDNKEVINQYVNIGPYARLSKNTVYKWIDSRFELIRRETNITENSGGLCIEKKEYYASSQIVNKTIKKGSCSDDALREYSHILDEFQ